jgi:CRISPR-associated endonuclease/helicase Cas3
LVDVTWCWITDVDAKLLAHSVNAVGVRHLLEEHLRGTGRRAAVFAEEFGADEVAGYLGLVHDVGKGTCNWQGGLLRAERVGGRVGIDHKRAGAWLAAQQKLELLSAVVLGHHGGLPDWDELKSAIAYGRSKGRGEVQEAVQRVAAVVPEILPAVPPRWPDWIGQADQLDTEVLVRMVFSAVVDADFLDTEQHFDSGRSRDVHPLDAAGLAERFEAGRAALLAGVDPSPVDAVRDRVYGEALDAAVGEQGIYRFPAPTGAGKTLASTGFAVHHAREHGLRRVIMAVPFLSITDQNADVLRRVLDRPGELPVVLEHHSGVDLDEGPEGASVQAVRWQRLAAENWDAPFVVTTTVRLFESLFGRKPSAMRRLHRLANSVIVLDEVQALPDRLLIPILSGLRTLTRWFGTTVVLASATQPAFWRLSPFKDEPMRDVVAEPGRLYADLRRVRYGTAVRSTRTSQGDQVQQTQSHPTSVPQRNRLGGRNPRSRPMAPFRHRHAHRASCQFGSPSGTSAFWAVVVAGSR